MTRKTNTQSTEKQRQDQQKQDSFLNSPVTQVIFLAFHYISQTPAAWIIVLKHNCYDNLLWLSLSQFQMLCRASTNNIHCHSQVLWKPYSVSTTNMQDSSWILKTSMRCKYETLNLTCMKWSWSNCDKIIVVGPWTLYHSLVESS